MSTHDQSKDAVLDVHINSNPVTVLDLAIHRGAKPDSDGNYSFEAIEATGLPAMGGCYACGACIAAYNACPAKTGYLHCQRGCIGDVGYATVEEANKALFEKGDDEEEHLIGDSHGGGR